MTISCVGYGDIYPTTAMSRIFTLFYCVIGVCVTANALGSFNSALKEYQQSVVEDKALSNTSLHQNSFRIMLKEIKSTECDDTTRPMDEISQDTYILYKLMKMNLVDEGIVNRIKLQFDRLDRDGSGTLNSSDIMNFNAISEDVSTVRKRWISPSGPSGECKVAPAQESDCVQQWDATQSLNELRSGDVTNV
eukprot:CAMPEP_0185038446 /NCGR_PEP_ID=MMETSP1103-20130426/34124_1 /TAXON_ID=36769 /ORGANISM="Paraphysomonas bandaiensis, Strain Caron Lab Isolate" /LENGTH=191 /DNA_ID=CAMNT_0027576877 /DNA_START=467 /DNA_END=1042 /DNA_ORIENTATION=-